jgi:hypothetical protein
MAQLNPVKVSVLYPYFLPEFSLSHFANTEFPASQPVDQAICKL